MKPAKQKASELFNKMYNTDDLMGNYPMCFDTAKQCALIAVDEIITAIENVFTKSVSKLNSTYRYYQEVKTEIEKL
jgi:hypothetical protein